MSPVAPVPATAAPIPNSDLWAVVAALQQDLAALRAELRALQARSADGAAPRPVAPDASLCQLPRSAGEPQHRGWRAGGQERGSRQYTDECSTEKTRPDPAKEIAAFELILQIPAEGGETEARPGSEPSVAALQRDLAELNTNHLALQRRFEDELAKQAAPEPQLAHTRSSKRQTSFISSLMMALEHQDPAKDENAQEDETEGEEWELAESMWDACLLLGCKSKRYPGGVGFVVTAYALVVLLLNALIQTTFVFIVVYRLGTNPDVDSGTIADLRCASRADRGASSPKRRVLCAGSTVRTSPTPSRTWTPSRMFLSQRRSVTTWRGLSSLSKSTRSKRSYSTRKGTLGLCSAASAALCGSSKYARSPPPAPLHFKTISRQHGTPSCAVSHRHSIVSHPAQ